MNFFSLQIHNIYPCPCLNQDSDVSLSDGEEGSLSASAAASGLESRSGTDNSSASEQGIKNYLEAAILNKSSPVVRSTQPMTTGKDPCPFAMMVPC